MSSKMSRVDQPDTHECRLPENGVASNAQLPQDADPPRRPAHGDTTLCSERVGKRPRGFAGMDRKTVSEIARKGGIAAHAGGTAHQFTSDEARIAGRKGGRAAHEKRRKAIDSPANGKDRPS